jgi:2-C-methyl-D-erythritol 4-phosphate cytidylyltransferase
LRLSAVIVAAGSSTRAGFDKLFANIAGRPVMEHAIGAFEKTACVQQIVVVTRPEKVEPAQSIARSFRKVRAVVSGGARRQDSVRAGLGALSGESEFVAVHDAARPLITPAEIERVFAAAQKYGAAVLARPVTDTLKTADAQRFVTGSIDRGNVFAMQTPQVFARATLMAAYGRVEHESLEITDEVSAVQMLGINVVIVPADEANLKITFAADVPVAEFILQQRNVNRR